MSPEAAAELDEQKPPQEEADGGESSEEQDDSAEPSEELQAAFEKTKNDCNSRDLVARRMEVRDDWQQRYFWRGHQYLTPGPYGQWAFASEGLFLSAKPTEDEDIDETNIYRAYGLKIIGVLTQNVPAVRFWPDMDDAGGEKTIALNIRAASAKNNMKQIIEREQKGMKTVQEDITRYLYTDGRAVVIVEFDEEAGKECFEVVGGLESKLPIQQNRLEKCFYCIVSKEIDILDAKQKFPDKADEIQGGTAPAAESEFERLARIACMQGMRPSSLTGDSLQWNVTYQRVFLTPTAYAEYEDAVKDEAETKFPDGVCLHYIGKTFCEAEPCEPHKRLTLIHACSGDGMHRNSIGSPVVPIQKKMNDAVDLQQQTLLNTIPVKWVDPTYVDTAAMKEQENLPGSYLKLAKSPPPNTPMEQFIMQEETVDVPPSLPQWIAMLRDQFPQLMTGAYPAMSGDDTGGNDTAHGIAIQKDSAMGLIGIYWRNMKEGYAQLMDNAVACAANRRKGKATARVPGPNGEQRTLVVDIDDLKGNTFCYPETSEAYPVSWVQKRGTIMTVMQDQDPAVAAIRQLPPNQMLIQQMLGVDGLTIPQVLSYQKQLGEIDELCNGEPEPNPQIAVIREKLQQFAADPEAQADPAAQQLAAHMQQALAAAQKTPLVSSVPIDDDDDHASESMTCWLFINSPEGQQLKKTQPQAYQNVKLHKKEHDAAQAAKQQAPRPTKPPSVSIPLDPSKLPPAEAAQAVQMAGIQATPQDFGVQQAAAAAEKHPKDISVQA